MPSDPLKKIADDRPTRSGPGLLRRGWRSIADWCGDTGRLLIGFASLNFRKSVFRLAPHRIACPCQNPSDSGKAGETGCDAVAQWHSGERFRILCPLLKKNPEGLWRCSVATADVRPFWGRALAVLVLGTLGIYAAAGFGVYSLLHSVIGYPVRYASVAWPPDWGEIRHARARFFFDKADHAFKSGQTSEAMMWLSQSYELDSGNYLAGRVLAQLWQNSEAEVSDRIFRQLLQEHPDKSGETAQAWFLALLSRGDFNALGGLAWDRLHVQADQSSVWLNALLVASRQTGDLRYLQQAITSPAGLPRYVPVICSWELRLRSADRQAMLALLTQSIPSQSVPYAFYYRIDRLLHAGMATEALRQIKLSFAQLDSRDRLVLGLDAYAESGWQDILGVQVDKLLATDPGNASLVELLSAHLIRHPNPYIFVKLFNAVAGHPIGGSASDKLTAYACMFCAAGASGDWARQAQLAAAIKSITGAKYKTLDAIQAYFRTQTQTLPIERYLPAMPPLPVDVTLALFEFSLRQRAAGAAAAPRIRVPNNTR